MKLLHAGHVCKHIDVDIQLRLEQDKFSKVIIAIWACWRVGCQKLAITWPQRASADICPSA